jgi:hypothetical protein
MADYSSKPASAGFVFVGAANKQFGHKNPAFRRVFVVWRPLWTRTKANYLACML